MRRPISDPEVTLRVEMQFDDTLLGQAYRFSQEHVLVLMEPVPTAAEMANTPELHATFLDRREMRKRIIDMICGNIALSIAQALEKHKCPPST